MPQPSFESRLSPVAPPVVEQGPILEHSSPGSDATGELQIRARRIYSASRDEVFAAWTNRTAWETWMRLRAKSRASLASYQGGAFRLELAEGPTIHVITGAFVVHKAPDHLRFSWQHHDGYDRASTVDVTIRSRRDASELSLIHLDIASRREAAWLMRFWATVMRRLDQYLASHEAEPHFTPRRPLQLVGAAVASDSVIRPASSRA